MRENDLLKQILEYLGLKQYFCFRNNTGAFRNSRGGFYRFGFKGSGDILGLTPAGRFFSIEVKLKGKYPSPEQKDFMLTIVKNGGIAFVAYCLEDVEKKLLTK